MRKLTLAGLALLVALGGAALYAGSARADDVGSGKQTMEQYLTTVTEDVDAYWTGVFKDSGLPEPRVGYAWLPDGQTAAYSPDTDTIYISKEFAAGIYDGALDQALPGSANGYGGAAGDFAVAYIVAHEYGHQIQDELGLYQRGLPTMDYELQADCFAGTWAKSAQERKLLEEGDVQEALDAALAVGDFDTANEGHHGTPEQREEAWKQGFESGDPSSCGRYLEAA
jgi:uncharacterized protein